MSKVLAYFITVTTVLKSVFGNITEIDIDFAKGVNIGSVTNKICDILELHQIAWDRQVAEH